jgi:phosphoglycerate dehydrogenase-like enzyme
MIRILIASPLGPEAIDQLNEIPEFEINTKPSLSSEQLLAEIAGADALVCGGSPVVSATHLAAATGLKLIVTIGATDAVDAPAAQRRGIDVRRSAQEGTVAVLKDFFNV